MLAKRERLTKSDFDRFFASGRRSHDSLFTLIYSPSPTFHGAVVAPKKILKSAVGRNTLRRRVYDVLRRTARGGGGVYIILLKKEAVSAKPEQLRERIAAAVGRTNNKG